MTTTTQERITRELARLRMEQSDGDPATLALKTEEAHSRINQLLDLLEAEHIHA